MPQHYLATLAEGLSGFYICRTSSTVDPDLIREYTRPAGWREKGENAGERLFSTPTDVISQWVEAFRHPQSQHICEGVCLSVPVHFPGCSGECSFGEVRFWMYLGIVLGGDSKSRTLSKINKTRSNV